MQGHHAEVQTLGISSYLLMNGLSADVKLNGLGRQANFCLLSSTRTFAVFSTSSFHS